VPGRVDAVVAAIRAAVAEAVMVVGVAGTVVGAADMAEIADMAVAAPLDFPDVERQDAAHRDAELPVAARADVLPVPANIITRVNTKPGRRISRTRQRHSLTAPVTNHNRRMTITTQTTTISITTRTITTTII